MPQVVGYAEAKAKQFGHRGALRTPFLEYRRDAPDEPVAFLSTGEPDRRTEPHWHYTDEFLVIVDGSGKFGRHDVAPYCVHYASGLTPYGPLVGGSDAGIQFFVLFAHFDPGAEYLTKSMDKLKQIPNRRPWQITRQVTFDGRGDSNAPVNVREVPGMKDEQGLFVATISMAAGARAPAHDPSHGDGQYLLVVDGSLIYNGAEYAAYTVVHVKPTEAPFELHAGAAGLQAIVMNFPRKIAVATVVSEAVQKPASKRWACELCAFVYDEALGLPGDDIPAGTCWADVPAAWTCPDCAAEKSDFKMVEPQ